MGASSKDEHEWAWELHKQCDILLHSRLTAYFIGHSFLISAFTAFSVSQNPKSYYFASVICAVGGITAIIWLFVNASMYARLEALNQKYLFRRDRNRPIGHFESIEDGEATKMRDVFTFYIYDSIVTKNVPFTPIPIRFYKTFIPYVTPWIFIIVWVVMFYIHVYLPIPKP